MSEEEVVFLAAYPPIQSAIKIDGQQNGARIQLDIPETEVANWIKSTMWRGEALEIRMRPIKEYGNGTISRTTAKQRTK